jgi:acyl-CoA synthetase (NDP forming)
VQNPVDCTPIWWDYHNIYPRVLDALAQSGEVDLVIVSLTDVAATLPLLVTSIASWAHQAQAIPIVVYWGARHRDFAICRPSKGRPCPATRRPARPSALPPRWCEQFRSERLGRARAASKRS